MDIIYSNLYTKIVDNYCNGVQTPCTWTYSNNHWASAWRWDGTICPNNCLCGTGQPDEPTETIPGNPYAGHIFDGVNYPDQIVLNTYCAQA
jgi:hypothetical protein